MRTLLLKLINAMYWIGLTLWVACIISAAVAAMGVFKTLPQLGLTIERYTPALGNDPSEHGRVAGGKVMEPIFTATDWLQTGAAAIVVLTLIAQALTHPNRLKSASNFGRALCILAAAALLTLHLFNFAPRMNRNLREYWQAIERNDGLAMTNHRQAFNHDHNMADRLVRVRLFLLLGAVALSGIAFTPKPPRELEGRGDHAG